MSAAAARPPSILPHPRREIEWWYLHGLLDERWLLMVSFWRYRGTKHLPEGLTATYALTAIDNRQRAQASWIDAAFLRQIRDIVGRLAVRKPDAYFRSFLEATSAGDVFSPYTLAGHSCLDASRRGELGIEVGGCSLHEEGAPGRLRIGIEDGEVDIKLSLDRGSAGFAMGRGGGFRTGGKQMWGRTEPRVPARGTLAWRHEATQEVAGVFWFDHQWGEWSFRTPRQHFYHPEWLYFATLLDDGSSLVVLQDKQPAGARRKKRFLYATIQAPGGACRHLEDVRIVASGERLESLRTNNTYEYGWTLELPEIDGRVTFEPFHRDQEVAVFTKQRGLLEAGCRVHGRLGGRAATGWGFVEAFGETLDINEYFWGQKKTTLAHQLERFLPRSFDAVWLQRVCQVAEPLQADRAALDGGIFGPLWSMMDRGGKGWRSTWLTTCYHAFGADGLEEQVRELLPVAELLHTGSLIIDDIQDGATTRRSRPALHLEVGEDIAINAGGFCYFLPFLILEELRGISDTQRAGMYAVVTNALRQGHLGQAADLMWSKGRYDVLARVEDFETTRAQLVEQYRLKSGCQLEAIARVAGILANAPPAWVEAAAAYSRVFGVVFQIIDDIIGIDEAETRLGKVAGEDVRNGKLNMVLLYALAGTDPDDRKTWVTRIFNGRNGSSVRAARRLIDFTGSTRRCLDLAEDMLAQASPALEILPPTDARLVMRSVPQWLLDQRREKVQRVRRPK